jgi:hypothetical protein
MQHRRQPDQPTALGPEHGALFYLNHTAVPAMDSHKNQAKRARAQRKRRKTCKAIALEVIAKTAYWSA